MLVLSLLVIVVVSFFTEQAEASKIQGLTFASFNSEQKAASRASWNRRDIIHTVIILGITTVYYIYSW